MAFDAIILTVPKDFVRLQTLSAKIAQNLPVDHIYIIGSQQVKQLMTAYSLDCRFLFLDEESLIPFESVRNIFKARFPGQEIARGLVGWYYQQFLKMAYSFVCKNDYYLSWDGDTVPIRQIEMFENGKPLLDWKREYCPLYFKTISALFPGMQKAIEPSFISEHMLFSKKHMQMMIQEINQAPHLFGETFYERILGVISDQDLNDTGFSEFETYGTYLAYRDPSFYKLRRWTSFRNCGQYFSPETISEEEIEWLSKDFYALSFEKGHKPEQENNVFQNPRYREHFSARYIIELIQEEMSEGYRETWD